MEKDYVRQSLEKGKALEDLVPFEIYSHAEFLEMLKKEPIPPRVSSGIEKLDDFIRGFEAGRLYVLSAPTKMGKTTLAQTFMFNLALFGQASLFFSYEMGWQEITKKYEQMKGEEPIPLPLFMPLELHRGGDGLQYQWLFDCIAKAKKEKNIKLVVIDHLHFLLPLMDFRNVSFIIGGIVREIKRMCVLLNIPIILIAHTSKIKDDKVADHTDIRDSSFITQEADVVLMLNREKNKNDAKKITDKQRNETDDIYSNVATLSVELNRMTGKTGRVILWHNGSMFEKYDSIIHGIAQLNNKKTCTNYPTR